MNVRLQARSLSGNNSFRAPKAQFGSGAISPKVKLAATKPVKARVGEGSISPKVKLAATKPVKAQVGDSNVSSTIKAKIARGTHNGATSSSFVQTRTR